MNNSVLVRPLSAAILVLVLFITSTSPGVETACEGGGGGSLIAVPSTLNFGEQATGGKYEKLEEFEAVGGNIATGGTLYEGAAEFSTRPTNACRS